MQCSEQFVEPNAQETDLSLNKQVRGSTKDYGDLIICLRDANGRPYYKGIVNEKEVTEYFPFPIVFSVLTGLPLKDDSGEYKTFELNDEGDPIITDTTLYMIMEADFGRLSLVRAPQSVLDAALLEAIAGLDQTGVTKITTDASGRLVAIIGAEDWLVNFDTTETGEYITENDEYDDKTIDSPVENMAIYQELMNHGFGGKLGILNSYFGQGNILNLAVGALAAGADKSGNIMVDEIAYLNNWILDWSLLGLVEGAVIGPDPKDRSYYNYGEGGANFEYSRDIYKDKYVKITTLDPNGTWLDEYVSLYKAVEWTDPERLIDYANKQNKNITGFANAVDDAIQVLEFIHSSDLIVYSPYFPPETGTEPKPQSKIKLF
ncbi:MAG: hypothetical protein MUP85_07695 [Candidatus Lokiarchaeota archaeon]|nr:hypothetical protein [Candidatus Lokiarchaeota archaeon]